MGESVYIWKNLKKQNSSVMKKLLFGLGIAALTLGSTTITTSCGGGEEKTEESCDKEHCDKKCCDKEGCSKECKEKCEKHCSKHCSKDSTSCSHDKKSCTHGEEGMQCESGKCGDGSATEEGTEVVDTTAAE